MVARERPGALDEKSRISQHLRANRSGFNSFYLAEPRQAAAKSASRVAKHTHLDVYQPLMRFGCVAEGLLLFGGLFLLCFRLLRFLGHVALRCPTIGSMQFEHRLAYRGAYTTIEKLIRWLANKVNARPRCHAFSNARESETTPHAPPVSPSERIPIRTDTGLRRASRSSFFSQGLPQRQPIPDAA